MITASLYDGKYQVEFNPRAHRYKIKDIDAIPDGVTTICNAVVPKFLDDWAGRVCVDYVRQGFLRHLEEQGTPPEQSAFLALCEEGATAHQRIRDSAGDRGSSAHDYIEKILTGEPCDLPDDPLVQASINAFSRWQDEWPCEVMDSERIVFSKEYFYCGKCDVYGLVNDKPSILDFKTGSGFYDDHPYQMTGYAVALEEELGVRIENGYIVHLDKRSANYQIYPVDINDGLKDAWAAAVRHYKYLKRVRQMTKEIKNGVAKGQIQQRG